MVKFSVAIRKYAELSMFSPWVVIANWLRKQRILTAAVYIDHKPSTQLPSCGQPSK